MFKDSKNLPEPQTLNTYPFFFQFFFWRRVFWIFLDFIKYVLVFITNTAFVYRSVRAVELSLDKASRRIVSFVVVLLFFF